MSHMGEDDTQQFLALGRLGPPAHWHADILMR